MSFTTPVQQAYDREEAIWFVELDAVHTEEMIYPQVNDNFVYISEFFENPWRSLTATASGHNYASFPFGLFMAKQFDTSIMRQCWEGARYNDTVFGALRDTLYANYGWTMDSAVAEMWLWNYLTGLRDDGQHYDDAFVYPLVTLSAEYTAYPVDTTVSSCMPEGYGACYVRFVRHTGDNGPLRIQFDGADSTDWAVWVVATKNGNNHTAWRMPIDSLTREGVLVVQSFEQYGSATLIAVNVSEYTTGAEFSYAARLVSAYDVELTSGTPDSTIYLQGDSGMAATDSQFGRHQRPLYSFLV